MRAGRQDVDLYSTLVDKLSRYGEVLTPFVPDKSITNLGSEHEGGDRAIHDRWDSNADKSLKLNMWPL